MNMFKNLNLWNYFKLFYNKYIREKILDFRKPNDKLKNELKILEQ